MSDTVTSDDLAKLLDEATKKLVEAKSIIQRVEQATTDKVSERRSIAGWTIPDGMVTLAIERVVERCRDGGAYPFVDIARMTVRELRHLVDSSTGETFVDESREEAIKMIEEGTHGIV